MNRVSSDQIEEQLLAAERALRQAEELRRTSEASWLAQVAQPESEGAAGEALATAKQVYLEAEAARAAVAETVDQLRRRLHDERRHELVVASLTDVILQRDAAREQARLHELAGHGHNGRRSLLDRLLGRR